MLSPRLDWMLGCCSCAGFEPHGQGELQVQLTSDRVAHPTRRHPLTKEDSFDITFTPRSFGDPDSPSASHSSRRTSRQQRVMDQLELPQLAMYPKPPSVESGDTDEDKRMKLLAMYREFASDLHTGMHLMQLTSSRDYSEIHCQLMEDLTILKLDQSNGRIIEFPLINVSKVYRIVKSEDKWYTPGSALLGSVSNSEQIVVVEFMRRKLAFVFRDLAVSQRFLICMELLIRRAQQKESGKAMRSLTPTFPPQIQGKQCPTPRLVHQA